MAESEGQDTEKSEDPTAKRLEDAIKRGDVAKSQEVNTWFLLLGGTLALFMFGGSAANKLAVAFRDVLGNLHLANDLTIVLHIIFRVLGQTLIAIGPVLAILVVACIAGSAIQHRLLWTTEPLAPKLNRISLISGAKRIFSKHALVQFVKGLLKLAIVGSVIYAVGASEVERTGLLIQGEIGLSLRVTFILALKIMAGVTVIMALIAAADYLWTKHEWYERQRMSVREVREEYKEQEGDPTIKAKLRQIRQSRSRKRMMQEVPGATVVVMNPTHFAVALKYEQGMGAPVCVAKGQDNIALKIREVATRSGVPVIQNPPLARALFKSVEIDQEIPTEHYKAVAELIGYVMKLRNAKRDPRYRN
ncbi:MAG: flagellar biosynthesis protein FlhB [Xanthobacteraceae bacterium]|nr:flagellar biosynthesis protein FlhB [Xanthobacteraceae bacterium]QYK44049.1 MAG: flagellar biosynthesis protein FlhB [Xanthobacteraceae bacterium]